MRNISIPPMRIIIILREPFLSIMRTAGFFGLQYAGVRTQYEERIHVRPAKEVLRRQTTYEKSKYFWIFTPEKDYRYEIISAYTTGVNSDTYTLFKGPGDEFQEYLDTIKGYSEIETDDTELTIKDRIVTLVHLYRQRRHQICGAGQTCGFCGTFPDPSGKGRD